MKRSLLLFQSFLLVFNLLQGQTSTTDSLLENISFNADVMVNAVLDRHRIKAHDQFEEALDSLLARPGSYNLPLDSIHWISILHGDGFRMVSWQLRISDDEYKYGGFIQWPDRIVRLKDTRPWVNGSTYNIYSPDAWYGCIYYKIIPFESDGKKYYVLFGFNAEDSQMNTKVADILDLNGDEPKLGVPLFVGNDKDRSRLILTYGDVSSVQLLYDPELKAIVQDHLESIPGISPSGGALVVSDGSMEGWFLKNGRWVYKEKMSDVKMDEPPMTDDRKNRKEDKDIFGRPKKQ